MPHLHSEFSVYVYVSWKNGLKAELVAKRRPYMVLLFFFSLSLPRSVSHRQYLLCPWRLNVFRCKWLQYFYNHLAPFSHMRHSFSHPPHSCSKNSIISPENTMRHTVEQKMRKISVSWVKVEHKQLWTCGLHVMMISLYLCMLIHMSHNCRLVFRGAHYTEDPHISPTAPHIHAGA